MFEGKRVLVTGAGGFIGGHVVEFLKGRGVWVRGVDITLPEFRTSRADEFELLDLRRWEDCQRAMKEIDIVFALAADMGGMGFISSHHAQILHNNALINLHSLEAAKDAGVQRYLYSSSACIYPEHLQTEAAVRPLKEEDAIPAQPQDAYGWEKLVSERACIHYKEDYGLETRVVRFHNIFGEFGTWQGGREKAPAAVCRKIAEAKMLGLSSIEIWGDGEQTRSFCHVDDCVEGMFRLLQSDFNQPINLGQDRMVSINELVDIVSKIAGVSLEKVYVEGPQGVRGRNSDNSLLRQVLGWEPSITLEDGLARTYQWIEREVFSSAGKSAPAGA